MRVRNHRSVLLDDGEGIVDAVRREELGQMPPEHLRSLLELVVTGQAHTAKVNRLWDKSALACMPERRILGNGFMSFSLKVAPDASAVPSRAQNSVRYQA